MRNSLAIVVFALLVAGIVSCTQPEPTAIPAPTPVPTSTIAVAPTPVPPAAATPTSAPAITVPDVATPTAVPVAVPNPQSAPPTPTPTQLAATITPAVVQEPPQDIPLPPTTPPPTPVPATVPPPGPSSQESASTGPKLTGKVVLSGAQELFSQRGLSLQPVVEEVSVFSLNGSQVVSGESGDSFTFDLPKDAPYLLKARIQGGGVLWALTPVLSGDTTQDISLETTYRAGLIYAAEGGGEIAGQSIAKSKERAIAALDVGADRLVNTVKRLVNNDLLWRVDYSIVLEMNEVNLRAFGGGLSPVRSLESVLSDPQPDYVPHIFMLNTAAGELFLDRILMSEMKADRWAAIVVAEDIAPRVYRGLGEFHVVHGGNTLAYGEDKCFEWTGQGADRECRIFRQLLVTYPLDATDGESPKVLTPVNAFDGANRP